MHLAIPAAIGNFLDTIQLLIDMLMIGRISPEAIAAVGLSGQLIILIYSFLSIFYVGTNAIASRYYGAKEFNNTYKVIFNMAILSFVVSLPFFFLVYLKNNYFFAFMGTDEKVSHLGSVYTSIISLSLPFLFIGSVLQSGVHATGDTKTPLLIGLLGNILNTFLNYCLIFGNFGFPRLEVKGAAIATAISYSFEVVIYLFLFFTGIKGLKFIYEFSYEITKKCLKVGIPAGIEKIFSFGSFLIFVKIIAKFGTYVLAGYQIGLRIEGIAFMPGFGFATAAMILVGQYLGAKKVELAEKSVMETLKISSVFMGMVGALFVIFPEFFVSFFTNNTTTIKEASLYLRIVGLSQIPLAIEFALNGALRGAGATKITLIVNNFSFWLFRIIPAYFVAILTKEIIYVYFVMIFETFVKAFILWKIFKRGKWKEIKI